MPSLNMKKWLIHKKPFLKKKYNLYSVKLRKELSELYLISPYFNEEDRPEKHTNIIEKMKKSEEVKDSYQ